MPGCTSAATSNALADLLARGAIPADQLISGVVPLEDTQSALEQLASGAAMKLLVDVSGRTR